jgi:cytoskeletal protein CcmA (bactofilin family)
MFEKQRTTKADTETPQQVVSPKPTEAPQTSVRGNSLIGTSVKIRGEISGEENIVIEGSVDGSIEFSSNEVTVGSAGRVSANIIAKTISIDGQVNGDITGHEKVVISRTGKVKGNIVAPRVTLEDGAQFKGSIDMDPSERNVASAPPVSSVNKQTISDKKVVSQPAPTSASSRV